MKVASEGARYQQRIFRNFSIGVEKFKVNFHKKKEEGRGDKKKDISHTLSRDTLESRSMNS